MADCFTLIRPLLHCLPPEAAHGLGVWALRHGLLRGSPAPHSPALQIKAFGLNFANPLGLAAGFDKNAVAVDALLGRGFGFVEAETVTPLAQSGNPKPRIFRLREDEAVVNRLGFNNVGLEKFIENFKRRDRSKGIAGVNIGKNKDSADAIADYVKGLKGVYPYADYVTVNISSPNTEGLRALQQRGALTVLLTSLTQMRAECIQLHGHPMPLLLKVAPDLTPKEKEDIVDIVLAQGIDGLVVSNTTVSRPTGLRSAYRDEQGGLSGRPLFALSTEALKDFYRLIDGKIPLIGVGGISSAQDAYAKIRAGATLVQLYTAITYQGFGVVRKILAGLDALLAKDGFINVQQAVGMDVYRTT